MFLIFIGLNAAFYLTQKPAPDFKTQLIDQTSVSKAYEVASTNPKAAFFKSLASTIGRPTTKALAFLAIAS